MDKATYSTGYCRLLSSQSYHRVLNDAVSDQRTVVGRGVCLALGVRANLFCCGGYRGTL
jgi:hypothetical protein